MEKYCYLTPSSVFSEKIIPFQEYSSAGRAVGEGNKSHQRNNHDSDARF
jgi:hypothetical protein